MKDHIGSGWAFPVSVDGRGRIAMARRERDVEESIHLILLTPVGQRVMRPDFGCRVHDLVFAPNDATTSGLAAVYVREALERWEPRIQLLGVDANPDSERPERLLIDIRYRVKATREPRSLVFPFYREPSAR